MTVLSHNRVSIFFQMSLEQFLSNKTKIALHDLNPNCGKSKAFLLKIHAQHSCTLLQDPSRFPFVSSSSASSSSLVSNLQLSKR